MKTQTMIALADRDQDLGIVPAEKARKEAQAYADQKVG
jgi:hypothetical protein